MAPDSSRSDRRDREVSNRGRNPVHGGCDLRFREGLRPVKIKIAWVGKTKEPAIQALTDDYLQRLSRYAETVGIAAKDEAGILDLARGERQSEKHKLVLLDSRGKALSSEELAQFLEREQLQALPLLFAVGGADGFSERAR